MSGESRAVPPSPRGVGDAAIRSAMRVGERDQLLSDHLLELPASSREHIRQPDVVKDRQIVVAQGVEADLKAR
jgi:hypothetical protein